MLLANGLTRKLLRYAKAAALAPRRINEAVERIGYLESVVERLPVSLASAIGRAATPELQRYPGYSESDLAIFDQFRKGRLQPEPGFITDFLGTRIRTTSVHSPVRYLDGTVLGLPVPGDFHCEAAEWIGLLKAVRSAGDSFTAMELGAATPPWLVAGSVAARNRGIKNVLLCGVEADPNRYAMMQDHFRNNGLDPNQHTLLQAAVGAAAGKARWPKVANPTDDLGTRPFTQSHMADGGSQPSETDYRGIRSEEYTDVEIVAFSSLLEGQPTWDLVHIDVQGWEESICSAAIDLLNHRVRWLIIGTHSRKLDGNLVDLFLNNGWALENEKPTRFTYRPSVGSLEGMTTCDGVQVWLNPRLG